MTAPAAMPARQWSPQQQEIFRHFSSRRTDLIVRARAGTGKSTTILEAIDYASERRIGLCAFNRRIADELKGRLRSPHAEALTLHSLGYRMIRQHSGWPSPRVDGGRGHRIAREIAGEQEPREVIEAVAKLADLAKQIHPLSAHHGRNLEALAIGYDVTLDEQDYPTWDETALASAALKCMERSEQQDGTIDYTDMLYLPLACGWTRTVLDLVVVDEAQDVSPAQLLLAQSVRMTGGRMVLVGDDRQAIYGFRGADSGSLDRMKAVLGAAELGLTVTYRCPRAVVALARELVPDFEAHVSAPEGTVRSLPFPLLLQQCQPGDFVLSRTNAPLARVCLALLRAGTRARIEGRDVGAGLQKLIDRLGKGCDLLAFLDRLGAWEQRECAKAVAAERDARADHVHDQADTLRELSDDCEDLDDLRERVARLFADDGSPSVVCSTVHKAKGLEAPRVFVLEATLNRGKPWRSAVGEEANVCYVAFTRAQRELVLVEGLS